VSELRMRINGALIAVMAVAAFTTSCVTYSDEQVDLAWSYYRAAEAWLELENSSEAEPLLFKALELYPDLEEARFALVELYLERENFDEALVQAERLYLNDPGEPASQEILAYLYGTTGDSERALELYLGLASDQERADLEYNIGRLYQQTERPGESRLSYERAVSLDPGFVPAASALARMDYSEGNPSRVILLLADLESQLIDFPGGAITLALAYADEGLTPEFLSWTGALLEAYARGSDLSEDTHTDWKLTVLRRARVLAELALDDTAALALYSSIFEWEFLDIQGWESELFYLSDVPSIPQTLAYIEEIISRNPSEN
jgi:tetratricopeptide (TPR) repeat protein